MTLHEHAALLTLAEQRAVERRRLVLAGKGDGGRAWQRELESWPVAEPLNGRRMKGGNAA